MSEHDDLTAATSVEPLSEPGVFRLRVLPGWDQGRGAFGGLVLGAITRAIVATEKDGDRLLRSLMGAITAPVLVGDAEIRVTELRRGNAMTTYDAVLVQEGEVRARGTAILGRKRNDARRWAPSPPSSVTPESRPIESLPMAPGFAQHFEFRTTGAHPFSGGSDPLAEGYTRARVPPPSLGPAEIVAYVDSWWPSSFVIDTMPRPMATVAFTMQWFPSDTPLPPERPLRYRARSLASHDGYLMEMRELWTEHGELVALNQQTFVVIK